MNIFLFLSVNDGCIIPVVLCQSAIMQTFSYFFFFIAFFEDIVIRAHGHDHVAMSSKFYVTAGSC